MLFLLNLALPMRFDVSSAFVGFPEFVIGHLR